MVVRPVDLEGPGSTVSVDARGCQHASIVARGHLDPDHRANGGREPPGYPRGVSLEIDHVTKRFRHTLALDALTFSVPEGAIFGFLGANGAGKTTTMRICLGILRADGGEVRWDGREASTLPRRTWGYLPEERGLYPRSPVIDQLVYFASLYGEPTAAARAEAKVWLDRFGLGPMADRRVEELSKGNQQKVQFIAAVLHRPRILLMDEPFTGLDPVNLGILRDAFLELRDDGRTLVFSTHQMETAESLCETVAIVDRGRVVAGGTVGELKRASGQRTVHLALDGEIAPPWLAALPGVTSVRPGPGYAELALAVGAEPGAILAAVVGRGASVTRFELAEPSLEALFIEHVGRPPHEDSRDALDVASRPASIGGVA
jgi:ABC-2 type transport system ATP-binding protein